MDLTLFLGSGIHWKNDIPGVDQLTETLLNDHWVRNSDGQYFPYEHPNADIGAGISAESYQDFLKLLKEKNDRYLSSRHYSSNYEDLYHLVELINKEYTGSIDNLPVKRFTEDIIDSTFLFRKKASITEHVSDIGDLTYDALNFIDHSIRHSLSGYEPQNLELISQIADQSELNTLNIFTLNHDTLTEILLANNGKRFFDGFTEEDGEVMWYNRDFNYSEYTIRLFKLHGSINWFYAESEGNNRWGFAKLTGNDIWYNKNGAGNYVRALESQGHFLSGIGKDRYYHFGIYADVHNSFYNELKNTETIIMSGYGWQDRVINGKIFDWASKSTSRRIIIIHPNPDNLLKEPRKYSTNLKVLRSEGKIQFIKQGFEETNLSDLEAYIN